MTVASASADTFDAFGRFRNVAAERAFRNASWDEDRSALVRMSWAAAALFMMGCFIDVYTVGWGTFDFFLSMGIRTLCAIAIGAFAITVSRTSDFGRADISAFCHEILLITGYVAITNLAPDYVYVQANVMLAFLIFMWFFVPIHAKFTIAASLVVIAGYLFVHFRHAPEDYASLNAALILFVGISVMGFLSSRAQAILKRCNASHQENLLTANEELHKEIESRKEAEIKETSSRAMFEGLFRASPMPLVLTDNNDGVVLNANDACLQLLGVSEEDIVGQKHKDFVADSEAYDELDRLVDMKPGSVSAEIQVKTGGDELRDCLVSSVRFGGMDQNLVLTGLYDITERKEFERDLVNARLEAETAQRVQTEFLATMSHEIRTPLNALLGFLQVIEFDETSGPVKSNLALARQSGEHLLRLITDILDLSKLSSGKIELEPINVNCQEMCNEALETFALSAQEKDLETSFKIDLLLECFKFDELRVRQVLFNLIGNAIKFTHSGSVELSLSQNPLGSAGRDTLRFEISDTGIGLDPEKIDLLFQEFTQGDASVTRKFGGTGLGLAISRKLVEAMGGEIGASANTNSGATFWFEIPATPITIDCGVCSGKSELSHSAIIEETSNSSLKVLVAEDNPMNQRVVKAFLSSLGVECKIVENGKLAVEALREEDYSLVLMDIQMPVLDGLSAIRFIRSGATPNPSIPIAVLTANAMAGDRESYLKAGADEYLSKPVTLDALDRVLKELSRKNDRQVEAARKA